MMRLAVALSAACLLGRVAASRPALVHEHMTGKSASELDSNATAPEQHDASSAKKEELNMRHAFAEFIAMFLFVTIGCGTAMSNAKEGETAPIFQIALTFGLAITVLAYAIGHYSGGHINSSITIAMALDGQISWVQAAANVLAQLFGSLLGAGFLAVVFPETKDGTKGHATNKVAEGFSTTQALLMEIAMTFLLAYTVFETAINPEDKANVHMAPLAIGLSVFLAHSVLIPIDGCSINPSRSFGPEVVCRLRYGKGSDDHWVYWVGPIIGSCLAVVIYRCMAFRHPMEALMNWSEK